MFPFDEVIIFAVVNVYTKWFEWLIDFFIILTSIDITQYIRIVFNIRLSKTVMYHSLTKTYMNINSKHHFYYIDIIQA